MIDGGKGQLAAGMRALQPLVERGITVISLAKRLEEVYVPGSSRPLPIHPDSEASRLLQRVRDEAHRFALEGHRKRRGRAMTTSVLDDLPGIGPARKRALLGHFGSPGARPQRQPPGAGGGAGDPGQARARDPRPDQQDRIAVSTRDRATRPRPGFPDNEGVPEAAISVKGLRKSYGRHEAVRGIDLEVREGEIFAFLGPNGAGKTTTVEILEGYRERTGGEVEVLGTDPGEGDLDWRGRLGIVLQECRMEQKLTVRETLEMYAGYFPSPRDVDSTIELVGLAEKADARNGSLSGGQQRRLDVGVALVGDAELLFLDEPTTGFDPSARRHFWEVIAGLRELGKTVFLTTHYMDEAQALADRVAVIRGGEIVATGTPDDLGGRGEAESLISFSLPLGVDSTALPGSLAASLQGSNGKISLQTAHPVSALNDLTAWALERDVELVGLEVRRPSLEDVYLELTGPDE